MGASRVACASFNIGTNTTITITSDKKAYTHTLKYSFNGATGTIVANTTETAYVWTPPEDTFYSNIPNTTSGYGTLICETYEGSTLIGTTTCGFYAYTVRSACEPTVSGTVVDTNPDTIALTGSSDTLVLYLSKPECTISATAKNGATIKNIQIENPIGLVATTSPYIFETVYNKEFHFKATDSRGYSTGISVYAPNFVEYLPCHFDITPNVTRPESTATTANTKLSGYCFNGSFGVASNELSVKYRYKTSDKEYGSYESIDAIWNTDGTFEADVIITGLLVEETYIVEFVVSDKLTSFPVEVVLGQSTGDFRIAKDYIQAKNNLYIGTENNTDYKALIVRRLLNDKHYEANFGAGEEGSSSIELYEDKERVAKYDLRKDGYIYNALSKMSVAEIMSILPSEIGDGAHGYFLLNGGENADPVLVQWGRVVVTPTAPNTVTRQTVSFLHPNTSIPFVSLEKTMGNPSSVSANVGDVSKEGFTIYLQRTSTASTPMIWVSIGNGTAFLPK